MHACTHFARSIGDKGKSWGELSALVRNVLLEVVGNRDCNSTARRLERRFHLSLCPKFRDRFRIGQVLCDFPMARILSVDFLFRTDTRPGNILGKLESRADLRPISAANTTPPYPQFFRHFLRSIVERMVINPM